MSKEVRESSEIQKEYSMLCAQLGQKAYQREVLKAEMQQGYLRIQELGKEMSKVKSPQQEQQAPVGVPIEEKPNAESVAVSTQPNS